MHYDVTIIKFRNLLLYNKLCKLSNYAIILLKKTFFSSILRNKIYVSRIL